MKKTKQALRLNGQYIHDIIDGFMVLSTTGRETIETELTTETVGNMDGSKLLRRRYMEREIEVEYFIMATDRGELMSKYDALNELLDCDSAQLIFDDEPDKFYIATKSEYATPEGLDFAHTGIITFICGDPHKYSVDEYAATYYPKAVLDAGGNFTNYENNITYNTETGEQTGGGYYAVNSSGAYLQDAGSRAVFPVPTFVVDYDGTMPSRPTLQAFPHADNGYFAFVDENENQIQLGSVEDIDGEIVESDTLLNHKFSKGAGGFAADSSARFPTSTKATVKKSGTLTTGTVKGKTALKLNTYGTFSKTAGWINGAARTFTFPADSGGVTGAESFAAEYQYIFYGKQAQASQLIYALNDNSRTIAGVRLYTNRNSAKGHAEIYIGGTLKKTLSFTATKSNKYTNGTLRIVKEGAKITVTVGGKAYSYTAATLQDVKTLKTSIYIGRPEYKGKTQYYNCAALDYIGVYSVKIIKNHVDAWVDVPNKFNADDVVIVNIPDASVVINDVPADGLGALGNDWETFALQSGRNYIGCAWSDWATTPPEFALTYRKVYI